MDKCLKQFLVLEKKSQLLNSDNFDISSVLYVCYYYKRNEYTIQQTLREHFIKFRFKKFIRL